MRIKEAEVRHRELEVEAMHLKVRALELEQAAALAASSSTPQSPWSDSRVGFGVGRHIDLVPPFGE